jgi:hypothetical protein
MNDYESLRHTPRPNGRNQTRQSGRGAISRQLSAVSFCTSDDSIFLISVTRASS